MSESTRLFVRLTGSEREQLHAAMLAAFDHATLKRLVSFKLGERLDALVEDAGLSEMLVNLIDWAEREGRVVELARGAHSLQPDSAALTAACDVIEAAGARGPEGTGATVRSSRMTPLTWFVASLGASGIAAAAVTYLASHWHLDTAVRLDLFTERLSFATRGDQPQLLDLGIEFSRLTFARCGGVEFEGVTLSSSRESAAPERLNCRDSDAKIDLEGNVDAGPRLGTLSVMTLEPGTEVILSVAGNREQVIRIERSGRPFTLDVPVEHGLDVVTSFVDAEPAATGSTAPRDLTRYEVAFVATAPRHALRLASKERGVADLILGVSPTSPPPSLKAPISVEAFAVTKEAARGYATTALVAPGSLTYVDYPTFRTLSISEDDALALSSMSATQIRSLSVVSPPEAAGRKSRYALHVTVEGNLESAKVGRGDPGTSDKTHDGRWADPRLTVYDVVTNGWWKIAALAASWTVATIGGAYWGWKKLSG